MRMPPPASVCWRPTPAAIRRRAAILLLATLCPLSWGRAASQAPSEETVTEVWVHDVPGPPQGDFWDPVSQHLLSVFTNPASVYPDVMVCARPLAGGKPTCTGVCWNLQGDTKLGGKLRSQECRLPLLIRLPAANHGMQLEVLEMDEMGGRPQVHATIARNIAVTDPLTCPHEKPCEMKLAKGSLVLSFGTQQRTAAEAQCMTRDEAATAALTKAYLKTKCACGNEGKTQEFAGNLYSFTRGGTTCYDFTGPNPGLESLATTAWDPANVQKRNATLVGTYHSHPWNAASSFSAGDLCTYVGSHKEDSSDAYYVVATNTNGGDLNVRRFNPNGRKFDKDTGANILECMLRFLPNSASDFTDAKCLLMESKWDWVGVSVGTITKLDNLPERVASECPTPSIGIACPKPLAGATSPLSAELVTGLKSAIENSVKNCTEK